MWMGGPLWSPAVALAWPGHGNGIPSTGGHKGPNPIPVPQTGFPTPLPPLRETRSLAVFSFCFSLDCCLLVTQQCHPGRSEGSGSRGDEILRCAQDDSGGGKGLAVDLDGHSFAALEGKL